MQTEIISNPARELVSRIVAELAAARQADKKRKIAECIDELKIHLELSDDYAVKAKAAEALASL